MNEIYTYIQPYLTIEDRLSIKLLCKSIYARIINSHPHDLDKSIIEGDIFEVSNYIGRYIMECRELLLKLSGQFGFQLELKSLLYPLYNDIAISTCGEGSQLYEKFKHLIWERPNHLLINGFHYACKHGQMIVIDELIKLAEDNNGGSLTNHYISQMFTYLYAYNLEFDWFIRKYGMSIYPLQLASCSGARFCKLYRDNIGTQNKLGIEITHLFAIASRDGWINELISLEILPPSKEKWMSLRYIKDNNKVTCQILQSLTEEKVKFLIDNCNLSVDVLDYYRDDENKIIKIPRFMIENMILDHINNHSHNCKCLNRMINRVHIL